MPSGDKLGGENSIREAGRTVDLIGDGEEGEQLAARPIVRKSKSCYLPARRTFRGSRFCMRRVRRRQTYSFEVISKEGRHGLAGRGLLSDFVVREAFGGGLESLWTQNEGPSLAIKKSLL